MDRRGSAAKEAGVEKRIEEEPGMNTREPAEGKRTDAEGSSEIVAGGQPERPGTKTTPPVEGADDSDGAQRTTQSPRG
jgi:hypothetical protein